MSNAGPSFLTTILLTVSLGAQSASRPERPLEVGFLLLEGVYNSELMAPYDVFHHTVFHTRPGMKVLTVGRTRDAVRSFEGLRITPDHSLDDCPPLDVLVVPSARDNMGKDLQDARLIRWLKERGSRARYVLSVCDGAFLLAQAGLLDGRTCTTFPGDLSAFRKRFPKLSVVEDVSFVADGKAITGAGGARSYDPAMYLVEKLYGRRVARGIGKGLVIDWNLEAIPHQVGPARGARSRPRCFLPGEQVPLAVSVEDAAGRRLTLGEIAARHRKARGFVLYIVGGAEAADVRKRGGVWCEDSFDDLPLLRHLSMDWEPRGIVFLGVACPPVYHEARFGYDAGAFLTRLATDPVYLANRKRFVERTLALRKSEILPFANLFFDPRFRLLANPARGVPDARLGPAPEWQGRFKWYRDTQTYGTPTLWVLGPGLRVFGAPFFMNVYESPGRHLNYTAHDVGARLARLASAPR